VYSRNLGENHMRDNINLHTNMWIWKS